MVSKLESRLDVLVRSAPKSIDMLEWISRTALEVIGQTGLGYSFDDFGVKPSHPYSTAIKDLS